MRLVWIVIAIASMSTVYSMHDSPSSKALALVTYNHTSLLTQHDQEAIGDDLPHKKQKLNPDDVTGENHENPNIANPIAALPDTANVNNLINAATKVLLGDKQTFKCTHPGCDTILMSISGFKYHMRGHESNIEKLRPYLCKLCSDRFKQQSHLYSHMSSIHNLLRYYCSYENCNVSYARKADLNDHEKIFHLNLPKLRCRFCPHETHRLGNIRAHENIHTRAILYYCKKCNKDFTRSDARNTHEATCKKTLLIATPQDIIQPNDPQSNQFPMEGQ